MKSRFTISSLTNNKKLAENSNRKNFEIIE